MRRIPLGALQEREFRPLFTGQSVSLLGDAVTLFALASRTWVWLPVISVSLANMMDSVWLVLAATWVKQGHGGAGAWTVILIVSAVGTLVAGTTALRIKPRRPAIGMSTTLWIAAAVDLATVAAMLAAPSVWRLRRAGESQPKQSAPSLAAE